MQGAQFTVLIGTDLTSPGTCTTASACRNAQRAYTTIQWPTAGFPADAVFQALVQKLLAPELETVNVASNRDRKMEGPVEE